MPPHCCLRPRSQDTGGKKRRPADKGPNSFIAKNITRSTCSAIGSSSVLPSLPICAPRSCCPPPFLDAEFVKGYQGNGIRRVARCGGEVSYEWRKGNMRTRVPPSSMDRRAPRSMSSLWASSALATMLTAATESRS